MLARRKIHSAGHQDKFQRPPIVGAQRIQGTYWQASHSRGMHVISLSLSLSLSLSPSPSLSCARARALSLMLAHSHALSLSHTRARPRPRALSPCILLPLSAHARASERSNATNRFTDTLNKCHTCESKTSGAARAKRAALHSWYSLDLAALERVTRSLVGADRLRSELACPWARASHHAFLHQADAPLGTHYVLCWCVACRSDLGISHSAVGGS